MTEKTLDNMTGQEIKELINTNKMSIEELDASALRKLMDYETDMLCFGKGDVELICQCSDRLDIISDNGITDEEFFSAINKAKADYAAETDTAEDIQRNKVFSRKHFAIRRIGIAAAVIALMLAGTTLVAAAFGVNIFEYLKEIVRQPEGTEETIGSLLFYHEGEFKTYASIEELVNSESLNIMYPAKLPEDITVKSVRISNSQIGSKLIIISTNDENTLITIDINTTLSEDSFSDCDVYENNDMIFYIFKEDEYNAVCQHNGNQYFIKAHSYDDLILIIDNIKE